MDFKQLRQKLKESNKPSAEVVVEKKEETTFSKRAEAWIKSNKSKFEDQYGEGYEKVLYATANKMFKEAIEPGEYSCIFESKADKMAGQAVYDTKQREGRKVNYLLGEHKVACWDKDTRLITIEKAIVAEAKTDPSSLLKKAKLSGDIKKAMDHVVSAWSKKGPDALSKATKDAAEKFDVSVDDIEAQIERIFFNESKDFDALHVALEGISEGKEAISWKLRNGNSIDFDPEFANKLKVVYETINQKEKEMVYDLIHESEESFDHLKEYIQGEL